MSSERSRRIALLEQRMSKDLGLHDPEPDNQGPGHYNGIGDVLRQARERKELSLPDVATHLRISESYLAAIERGRFDQLPGRSYVLGFLRSYAAFLGLNADKVVAQYKMEADDDFARKQQLKFPTVRPEGRTPGLWLLPLVMILAALGYLAWYGWKTDLVSFDDMVPDVPERLRSDPPPALAADDAGPTVEPAAAARTPLPAGSLNATDEDELRLTRPGSDADTPPDAPGPLAQGGPAQESLDQGPRSPATAAPTSPASEVPAPDASRQATGPAPSGATDPDAPPPLPSDPDPSSATGDQPAAIGGETAAAVTPLAGQPEVEGRVFGSDDSRVVLRASADTWVQIEDSQRNLLLTRVLKAGDIYRAPNQAGLVLMTGNAGGLVVEVDGSPVPSLGPRGAVRRNVSLDPERLVDGSQVVN